MTHPTDLRSASRGRRIGGRVVDVVVVGAAPEMGLAHNDPGPDPS